jgi:hypothetical protein
MRSTDYEQARTGRAAPAALPSGKATDVQRGRFDDHSVDVAQARALRGGRRYESSIEQPLVRPGDGQDQDSESPRVGVHEAVQQGRRQRRATYQGVTKDTIKVVVCVPPTDVQLNPPAGGQPPTNRSTGKVGLIEDSILDAQQALAGRYELWGRKIEYSFVAYSGTDETAQRADAVKVAQMKPFAVINTSCGSVFSTEIAARKIVVPFGAGDEKSNLAQQPYRYTGQDANLQAQNVATWLGNEIAGDKAQFAGDAKFKTQTRKLGVVYATSAGTGAEIDMDNFNKQLAKHGVSKPAVEVAYTAPADTSTAAITAAGQEQAPVLIAKLKNAGVTSVVLLVSTAIVAPMTKAATANEYSPEWLMTGWAYQELSLFAAQYDQDQWAHAFGMSWFSPYATGNAGAATGQNVFDW